MADLKVRGRRPKEDLSLGHVLSQAPIRHPHSRTRTRGDSLSRHFAESISGTGTGICERLVREVRGNRRLTLIRVTPGATGCFWRRRTSSKARGVPGTTNLQAM